jgi:tRNA U54 and U55 pseudouridine synthase Pus10
MKLKVEELNDNLRIIKNMDDKENETFCYIIHDKFENLYRGIDYDYCFVCGNEFGSLQECLDYIKTSMDDCEQIEFV